MVEERSPEEEVESFWESIVVDERGLITEEDFKAALTKFLRESDQPERIVPLIFGGP